MPDANHATNATQLTRRFQDQGEKSQLPDAAGAVETEYVELPSDHTFSAFLAGLTPSRVLRDRLAVLSPQEERRMDFLVAKSIEDDGRKHRIAWALMDAATVALRNERKAVA